ncbi:GNAT family N-acetyltransferase [Halobellus limi]|nr:GNAT family N-acetyltransferase [Halobellus limi]
MLEFDRERVRRRIDDGDVLVAVVDEYGTPADVDESGGGETEREGETERGDRDTDGSETSADRVVGVCVLGAVDDDGDATGLAPTEVGDFAAVSDLVGTDRPATEIESIAVHRSRRGRGIGRALVDAAAARASGPLVARFHEQVRPFYDALGFEIREHGGETSRDDESGTGVGGSEDGGVEHAGDPAGSDDRLYGVLR